MGSSQPLWGQVQQCLVAVLAADPQARRDAEAHLEALQTVDEFPLALAAALTDQSVDLQLRTMACTVLKSYAKTHWCRIAETFKEPEPSPPVKEAVRRGLPLVLHDPSKAIRTNGAAVVSVVASWDWPEQWPGLSAQLLDCIKAGASATSVDGGLRVFAELASELSDTQLPQLVPLLLPEALRIVTAPPQGLDVGALARAISIFTDIITMAASTEKHHVVGVHLDSWLPVLGHIIATDEAPVAVRTQAVQAGKEVVQHYHKHAKALIAAHLLPPVWHALTTGVQRYVQEVVNGDEDGEGGYDSEGNEVDSQAFVYGLFGFVGAMVEVKALRTALAPSMDQLLYHVIAYMQPTSAQLAGWEGDGNQFVADEDDEGLAYHVRMAAIDLLHALADHAKQPAVSATFAAARTHLDQGAAARAAGDSNWWKISEASLVALGQLSDVVGPDQGPALSALLQTVYQQHLNAQGAPFLQGRALWLAARYATLVEGQVAADYLAVAVSALEPHHPAPVRILALRAVLYFADRLDAATLQPYLGTIFGQLASFVAAAGDDLLLLLLEVAERVARVDPAVTAAHEERLGPLALAVWIKHPNDPLLVSTVEDLVLALAETPALPALTARVVPTLVSVLQAPPSSVASGMQESAVELLATLLRATPPPLPAMLLDPVYPVLLHTLMATDDNAILQNGCEALTMYLKSGAEQLMTSHGIEGMVQVVGRVLQQDSDSAAVFVGRLISKLLRKVALGPVTEPLLHTTLLRLQRATMLSLEQALVSVFAQLMLLDLPQTLQVVDATQVEGRSGVEVLMAKWMDTQPNFHGKYDVNVTMAALCALLDSQLPLLQTLMVKGERIVDPAEQGVIRTRSKAKQMAERYTCIPLGLKVFQLLANELHDQLTREDEPDWEDEDDDDDDDLQAASEHGPRASPFAPAEDYEYLSDMLGKGLDMEGGDDEDDPELREDPLYKLDTKEHLVGYLQGFRGRHPEVFAAAFQTLPAHQQQELGKALGL